MKFTKTMGACTVAVLTLTLAVVLRFGQQRSEKYPIGLTVPDRALHGPGIHLEPYGIDLGGIAKPELESMAVAGFHDENCGLYIELNSSNRVIQVQNWKWLGIDFLKLASRVKQWTN